MAAPYPASTSCGSPTPSHYPRCPGCHCSHSWCFQVNAAPRTTCVSSPLTQSPAPHPSFPQARRDLPALPGVSEALLKDAQRGVFASVLLPGVGGDMMQVRGVGSRGGGEGGGGIEF